jgi:hypothetical protein
MKKKWGYMVFSLFVILIVIVYTKIMQIKGTTVYDCMNPNFEIENLNAAQKEDIPIEHLQFYEKVKYISFESDNICKKNYSIDFDDIPFNSLKGFPGKYRYFMDHGNIYDIASKNKFLIGRFNTLLIRVENVQLLNNKIQLSFESFGDDLLCSYMKLVYLSFNGNKEVKYIPLEPLENEVSIVINSNEKGKFLKTIYIFSATENESVLNYRLCDFYNNMEIE